MMDKLYSEEASFQHLQSGMTNKCESNDSLCCFCKGVLEDQQVNLLSFVTFSNGNGWLGLDPKENRIPVFDSCGHVIHLSCQLKMRGQNETNRVYMTCPLCKNSSNMLIPLK